MVEQRVFLNDTYVKYGPAKHKFYDEKFPADNSQFGD
jgi:hypothetical protein